jgi:hypothetical protein
MIRETDDSEVGEESDFCQSLGIVHGRVMGYL